MPVWHDDATIELSWLEAPKRVGDHWEYKVRSAPHTAATSRDTGSRCGCVGQFRLLWSVCAGDDWTGHGRQWDGALPAAAASAELVGRSGGLRTEENSGQHRGGRLRPVRPRLWALRTDFAAPTRYPGGIATPAYSGVLLRFYYVFHTKQGGGVAGAAWRSGHHITRVAG